MGGVGYGGSRVVMASWVGGLGFESHTELGLGMKGLLACGFVGLSMGRVRIRDAGRRD